MRKIKFAIVGCGHIANRHAEHIAKCAQLVAVCDILPERADLLAEKYSCKRYNSIEELLLNEKEAEVVAICTPNGLHAKNSIAALKSGKHVLCEKPMAISVRDSENMILSAEKARRNLFIVKQNRFNPPIVALKEAIDQGKLGKIFNVQLNCFWNRDDNYYLKSKWKGKKELDGGILYTQFSHFIDLLIWLVGDIEEALALGDNFMHKKLIETEDTGAVILRFDNGAIGTINYTVNSYGKNMEGSIAVFGEQGTVKVGGQYLNALEYQNIKDHKIEVTQESRPANDYGFYQGSMSNHDKVYENIVSVLNHGDTIATTGIEGLKTVMVIEKIYAQINSRKAEWQKVQ